MTAEMEAQEWRSGWEMSGAGQADGVGAVTETGIALYPLRCKATATGGNPLNILHMNSVGEHSFPQEARPERTEHMGLPQGESLPVQGLWGPLE